MKSRSVIAVVTAAALLGLMLCAAAASASTLALECGGKGPRNKDSAGTVLCAAAPGKARAIAGTVRDDAGKPVATKVTATFFSWTPAGGGSFTVKETSSTTISANANGAFSLPVKTSTRLNVKFSVEDAAHGVSAAVAEAQVSRRLDVKLKKLGGGKLKFTVKGANPVSVYVLDSAGYEISGLKPKRTSKAGVAIFDLGSRHGEFSYYVDVGALADLFWEDPRKTFHL